VTEKTPNTDSNPPDLILYWSTDWLKLNAEGTDVTTTEHLPKAAEFHLRITFMCTHKRRYFGNDVTQQMKTRPDLKFRLCTRIALQWLFAYKLLQSILDRSDVLILCHKQNNYWINNNVCIDSLPKTVLNSDSVTVSKSRLKTFVFSQAFPLSSAH